MSAPAGKVASVVEHWLPRMEVAGIASAMAREVIARAGDWSGWLAAWSEEGERHAALAADAEARGWHLTAGAAYARAAACYHFGQFMAFEDPAAKEAAAARKCALYRRAAPLLDPPAEFLEVAVDGGTLRGYLRRPAGTGPQALALILPGSDSTKEEFPALEQVFLARGMATFALDGPGQGEGRSLGPLRPDITAELDRVAAVLRRRSDLDGRIALVGMAFGGFLALRAAAGLGWVAAVISVNGFADLGAFEPGLPQVYRDNLRFALGTPDVALRARDFSVAGLAGPRCPALVIHGGRDRIFPIAEAEASAAFCRGEVTLRILAEGNHVCNNIHWIYRPLMADWLRDVLDGRAAGSAVPAGPGPG